jgi:hypothetical protein
MQELQLAYIDPGSGSFLVQALVASAAGIAVAVRRYWSEIKAFFGRSSDSDADGDSKSEGASEPQRRE